MKPVKLRLKWKTKSGTHYWWQPCEAAVAGIKVSCFGEYGRWYGRVASGSGFSRRTLIGRKVQRLTMADTEALLIEVLLGAYHASAAALDELGIEP